MDQLSDKAVEIVTSTAVALLAFLSNRTFAHFDERIKKNEEKHERILELLNKIDRDVVRLNTILEKTDERKHKRF